MLRMWASAESRTGLIIIAAVVVAGTLTGCSKDDDKKSDAKVEETGIDIENNPLGALSQLAKVGKEMQEKSEQMKDRKPVTPIRFDVLASLLPSPKGWERDGDPRAETTQMGEFKISTAMQNYQSGEGNERRRMKVNIVDGSYVPMVYAPFTMMSKFSREGMDGHSKGLTVGGNPAFEEWKKNSRQVTLTILVKDRFLITIDGHDVDKDLAREWAKFLPLDKFEKWAVDEVSGDDVSPPEEEEEDGEEDEAEEPDEEEEAATTADEPVKKTETAEPATPAKPAPAAPPKVAPAPAPAPAPAAAPATSPKKKWKKKKADE